MITGEKGFFKSEYILMTHSMGIFIYLFIFGREKFRLAIYFLQIA